MKKTFLARRNALFSSTDASIGVYALILAVVLLGVRLIAPNLFWHAFAPVFHSAEAVTAGSRQFFANFADAKQLGLQNEKLLKENAALSAENFALLEKERSLAGLFGFQSGRGDGTPQILAGVVARPPESPYDTLVLAEGSSSGVHIGMGAYGEGGVPIGIVSSLTDDFSRVTLFSSAGVRVHGWVGDSRIPVTITGSGGGSMRATLTRSAGVAVGDTVFAPGPGMLLIGKVVRVDSDPLSPSITLRIMPALNLFSITWVVLRDAGAALAGVALPASSTP